MNVQDSPSFRPFHVPVASECFTSGLGRTGSGVPSTWRGSAHSGVPSTWRGSAHSGVPSTWRGKRALRRALNLKRQPRMVRKLLLVHAILAQSCARLGQHIRQPSDTKPSTPKVHACARNGHMRDHRVCRGHVLSLDSFRARVQHPCELLAPVAQHGPPPVFGAKRAAA